MKKQTLLSIASISAYVALSVSSNVAFAQYDIRGYSNDKKGYLSKEDIYKQQSGVAQDLVEATTPYTGNSGGITNFGDAPPSNTQNTGTSTGSTNTGNGGTAQAPRLPDYCRSDSTINAGGNFNMTRPECDPSNIMYKTSFDADVQYSCERNFSSAFHHGNFGSPLPLVYPINMSESELEARLRSGFYLSWGETYANLTPQRRQAVRENIIASARRACFQLAAASMMWINSNRPLARECNSYLVNAFRGYHNDLDICPSFEAMEAAERAAGQ